LKSVEATPKQILASGAGYAQRQDQRTMAPQEIYFALEVVVVVVGRWAYYGVRFKFAA
jgi:hypothetical protein